MCREQRAATVALMQMLDRGPGDRQAVEGRGAAADLVQNHQRTFAGLVQNHGGFDHLDHESRTPARQIVGGTNAKACAPARRSSLAASAMADSRSKISSSSPSARSPALAILASISPSSEVVKRTCPASVWRWMKVAFKGAVISLSPCWAVTSTK